MVPIRTCSFCKIKMPKSEMIRIAIEKIDSINYAKHDIEQKINSRAIYFCGKKECILKSINLIKKGKFIIKNKADRDSLLICLENISNEMEE